MALTLSRQLSLKMLPKADGVYIAFFQADQNRLMALMRWYMIQISALLGRALYLRRDPDEDKLAEEAGMQIARLPPSLWDIQGQARLYNHLQREQPRVAVFDHLEHAFSWLACRPDQALKDAAMYLRQLHRVCPTIFCIYQHPPHTPYSQRERVRLYMDSFFYNSAPAPDLAK